MKDNRSYYDDFSDWYEQGRDEVPCVSGSSSVESLIHTLTMPMYVKLDVAQDCS